MESTFWTALGASSLAAIVTTIGIYVIRRFESWGSENTIYFICFAAGVLISVSFLHLVPKAFSMNANAPFYLFTGYISLHLFNRFINAFVCDKSSDEQYGIGLVPMLGIGFHSFIDGIIYPVTFSVSALAAIGMILHEFPEGIFTCVLLLKGVLRDRPALLAAFLAAAMTTPLLLVVTYYGLRLGTKLGRDRLRLVSFGLLLMMGLSGLAAPWLTP